MAALKPYQKKRFPIYFTGFAIGMAAMVAMLQVKKATAPDFDEVRDERPGIEIGVGGQIRLRLGEDPGHYIPWGFPTQLTVTKKDEHGQEEPVIHMEYRDLVDAETLVGPFSTAGVYALQAELYACDIPGEKYCAKIMLDLPVTVKAANEAPKEVPLAVDVKAVAIRAAAMGLAKEKESEAKAPAPSHS